MVDKDGWEGVSEPYVRGIYNVMKFCQFMKYLKEGATMWELGSIQPISG